MEIQIDIIEEYHKHIACRNWTHVPRVTDVIMVNSTAYDIHQVVWGSTTVAVVSLYVSKVVS